jgi:hypothetical protein
VIQDRWYRFREAIVARAAADYTRMMATGMVCIKLQSVRHDKGTLVYRECEIDTGVIEALNSVERRAAIETGQVQGNISAYRANLAEIHDLAKVARGAESHESMDRRGHGSGKIGQSHRTASQRKRRQRLVRGCGDTGADGWAIDQ